MCRDTRFIAKAIDVAKTSSHHFQIGAVIAKGHRIIAVGTNGRKTHPKQEAAKTYESSYVNSVHAELRAILRAPQGSLEGATIYVGRRLKNGTVGLSRPCKMCQMLIEAAGIRRVVWSTGIAWKSIESYEIKRIKT